MQKELLNKPEAILAGAGTGKTHTIVEKLKTLIAEKVCNPEKIVCITFSNEACESISRRVRSALEMEDGVKPIIRTFHGFSGDLLRMYGDKIGIGKDFKILDPDRAKIVLHSTLKVPAYYCHKYIAAIHNARDLGINIEDMEKHLSQLIGTQDYSELEKKRDALQFGFQTAYMQTEMGTSQGEKKGVLKELEALNELIEFKKFVQNWKTYEKIKKKQNYQDYSDLSANALLLLNNFPEIADNFEYIIVDEFQDTNKVQLDLIFALAPRGNVTVVGDLNQSIYRFRGAYKENFAEFKEHYRLEQKDIRNLSKSHRSTNKILRAAHKSIEHNYQNKDDCFEVQSAYGKEGENIEVFEMKNSREEARKVGEIIEKLKAEGMELDDICVMVRTHQQSQIIKKLLEMKGIQYCSLDKPSLLKQKHVKLVVDYLTLANTLKNNAPGGEHCWWDIFYQSDFSAEDMILLGGVIKDNKKEANLSTVLMQEIPKITFSEEGKMKSGFILDRIKSIIEQSNLPVPELILHTYKLMGIYSDETQEALLELNSFMEFAKDYAEFVATDLRSFIYHLSVLSSLDINVETDHLEQEGVRLMTTHATKGLEYKAVIVTNLAQKRFPLMRVTQNKLLPVHLHPEMRGLNSDVLTQRLSLWHDYEQQHQLHEERRLFYVACTRAREKLFLTYALDYGGKKHGPSQFLEELDFLKNGDVTFSADQNESYPLLAAGFENQHLSEKETKLPEKEISFSPSALLLFDECQKKYQYKYIYNMPDEEIVDWTAIKLGSFVHLVLETGVKERYTTEKQFSDFAHSIHDKQEWSAVDLGEALKMIRVFYQRNKDKYNKRSRTEQYLSAEIDGMKFLGFADRIDIHQNGDVEIIDYKTSRAPVGPKNRRWQLGFYAFAAQKFGRVRTLTLDMLRLEKPLTFVVDEGGNAVSPLSERMEGFNIFDVKEELLSSARQLLQCYKTGFKACPVDKHCEFCSEYVYKL